MTTGHGAKETRERAAKATAAPAPGRMYVPFFVELGQLSTDPVKRHPYPPSRAVEWEFWSARSRTRYSP